MHHLSGSLFWPIFCPQSPTSCSSAGQSPVLHPKWMKTRRMRSSGLSSSGQDPTHPYLSQPSISQAAPSSHHSQYWSTFCSLNQTYIYLSGHLTALVKISLELHLVTLLDHLHSLIPPWITGSLISVPFLKSFLGLIYNHPSCPVSYCHHVYFLHCWSHSL